MANAHVLEKEPPAQSASAGSTPASAGSLLPVRPVSGPRAVVHAPRRPRLPPRPTYSDAGVPAHPLDRYADWLVWSLAASTLIVAALGVSFGWI